MRQIDTIAIHCSATREGQPFGASDIDKWHRAQGWNGIGYHFVIKLDGTRETGRPLERAGSHVAGHNARSIGICYIGGVAADGKTPKDTRTPAQTAALKRLVGELLARFPGAKVKGHRDFPGVAKACPSFDVAAWLREAGLDGTERAAGAISLDPRPDIPQTIKRGSSGPDVLEWQKRLRALGYKVAANGVFSWETDTRTREFQKAKGLVEDGLVGPKTWGASA